MATPILSEQSRSFSVKPANAGSVRINTFDADGAALDVSSGYTLDSVLAQPATNANPDVAAVSLGSNMSAAFNTTGFTLSWTAAQADAIIAALACLQSLVAIRISNDAGTTSSLAATGTLTIDNRGALA